MRLKMMCIETVAVCMAFVGAARGADMQNSVPEIMPGPQSISFTGTVVETMNASRYTYVLVDTGKEKYWAAAPVFAVKVGAPVAIRGAMPTKDFYSTVLKRKFDELYLVGKISAPGAEPPTPAAGTLPEGHPTINWEGDEATTNMDFSGIQKAAGGKTIAEIWAQKAKLSGKQVSVRAKVVRVLPDIMGMNWIHLRDGTGAEGQNDLTVTTKGMPTLGQVITAAGRLSTDKDYGSGYRYDVILEDATLAD